MASRVGVSNVYVSFFLDADTPMRIVPVGEEFPGRFVLRLGGSSPEVSVSADNAALAHLRDVISEHLDVQGGER